MTNSEHTKRTIHNSGRIPTLPEFNSSCISHQHNTYLHSGMNLSPELPASATACKAELQQIVQQIISLYQEGPIVDGWLESNSGESSQPGYRLCGLDEAGNMWSYSCPSEELPSVSVAIARYHQLLQLLERKQRIETRLTVLADLLVHTSISSDS